MTESYGNRSVTYPSAGTKFGHWTFLRPGDGYKWAVLCVCGTEKEVVSQNVRQGASKSCGCTSNNPKILEMGASSKTHGVGYESKVYRTWRNAKNRCFNPKATKYKSYGSAGITMAPEWASSFETFSLAVGEAPSPLHSLDRIDNAKGYEPGNVRWATFKEQARNKKLTLMLTHLGETKPLISWAEAVGIFYGTLSDRLRRGWEVDAALTTPVRKVERKPK